MLGKVDAKQSTSMKQAIDHKWHELVQARPKPYIFWEFIEEERNRFLKNYEHSVTRHMTIPSLQSTVLVNVDIANSSNGMGWPPNSEVESYISSGRFEGRNEQEVAWLAHQWWETYLNEVDSLAEKFARDSQI